MRTIKRIVLFFAIIIFLWLAISTAIGIYAVEGALHVRRLPVTNDDLLHAQEVAKHSTASLSSVSITSRDGLRLDAWLIKPAHANGRAVILLHGQGDNRTGMLSYAQLLLDHGYETLLPDARAHGTSEGNLSTYGLNESDDVRLWFEWLRKNQTTQCIDAIGNSMGAGLILESLRTEPGFCAVVAESPFASFREAAYERMGQQFGLSDQFGRTVMRPAIELGSLYVRLRYSLDLTQASPEDAAALSSVPVFLIHGRDDSNLPYRHSELIRAAMEGNHHTPELWEPDGTEHCGALDTEPGEYQRRVLAWFSAHDPQVDSLAR